MSERNDRMLVESWPVSVAMTPPAVRTVVIEVIHLEGDKWDTVFHPVIAVQVVIEYELYIFCPEGLFPSCTGTLKDVQNDGWRLGEKKMSTNLIFVDREYGPIAHNDSLLECDNNIHTAASCPWPPEQDAERLQDIIEECKERVLRREAVSARLK